MPYRSLLFVLLFSCSAFSYSLTVSELPFIDGLPLSVQASADDSNWVVLDSSLNSTESVVHGWVWLARQGCNAYLIYSGADVLIDSSIIPSDLGVPSEGVLVRFSCELAESFSFARFGGQIIVVGKEVTVTYPANAELLPADNFVISEGALILPEAEFTTDGYFELLKCGGLFCSLRVDSEAARIRSFLMMSL